MAPATDAREAHRQAALVTFGGLQTFEGQLKYQGRLDRSNRTKALGGVGADPAIHLPDLAIVEARVGLGEGHQLALVIPEAKAVVGVEVRPPTTPGLGVEQDGIEVEGL